MIWNTAKNVIYNGSSVQSVIYNGSVIWPSSPAIPSGAWSASGFHSAGLGVTYGVYSLPMFYSFKWLADEHPSTTILSSGSLYFNKTASGFEALKPATASMHSSLLVGERHSGLYIYISASASASGTSNNLKWNTTVAYSGKPSSYFSSVSGSGISGHLSDGTVWTSHLRVPYTSLNEFTASALLTAASAIISDRGVGERYGAGISISGGSAKIRTNMYWFASGVYMP